MPPLLNDSLLARATWHAENVGEGPLSVCLSGHTENADFDRPPGDSGFRVVVPLSGGLDSSTCAMMAMEAGLPVTGVYLADDSTLAEGETTAIFNIFGDDDRIELLKMHLDPVDWITYEGEGTDATLIWRARNLVFIMAALEAAQSAGAEWGQIWFGNQSGPGETPIENGGDKGLDFLRYTNDMLAGTGFTVTSPLIGMTKVDEVAWWQSHRILEKSRHAYSCGAKHWRACGRCWQCWRTFCAFLPYGLHPSQFPEGIDFSHIPAALPAPGGEKWQGTRMNPFRFAIDTLDLSGSYSHPDVVMFG